MYKYELSLKCEYKKGESETISAELLNCEAYVIIDFIYKLLHYRMDGDYNTENDAIEKIRKVIRGADNKHNNTHFTGLPYKDICTHKTVREKDGEVISVEYPYVKEYDIYTDKNTNVNI